MHEMTDKEKNYITIVSILLIIALLILFSWDKDRVRTPCEGIYEPYSHMRCVFEQGKKETANDPSINNKE